MAPVKLKTPSIFKKKGAYRVEKMIQAGSSVEEACNETGWSRKRVMNFMASETMLERMNDFLAKLYFVHQIRVPVFQYHYCEKLFQKALEEDDKVTARQALRLLNKFRSDGKKGGPSIINPYVTNIIQGVEKRRKELNPKEVEKAFGYEELPKEFGLRHESEADSHDPQESA